MPHLPANLLPDQITAVIDTREQLPLDLAPMQTVAGTLATGDYSVLGLENVISIERKSLGDLLACVGTARERFEKEVQRLLAYPTRALVIESTWAELERGDWRGKVRPTSATGSILGWIARGLPVVMARDHDTAGRYVSWMLLLAARRRWKEAWELCRGIEA